MLTILLIYTITRCIICNTLSITIQINPVSALKLNTNQESSYDSCHRTKHLTQLLKASFAWWNLERRPDGFWTQTPLPHCSQMPAVDSILQWVMSTSRCELHLYQMTHLSLSFLRPPPPLYLPPSREILSSPRGWKLAFICYVLWSSSELSNSSHGRNDL